jgi:hypothetical protein
MTSSPPTGKGSNAQPAGDNATTDQPGGTQPPEHASRRDVGGTTPLYTQKPAELMATMVAKRG